MLPKRHQPRWLMVLAATAASLAAAAVPVRAAAAQVGTVIGPGVISTDSAYEMNATFSHGGTRLYFSRCHGERAAMNCRILVARRAGDDWGVPAPVSFTTDAADFDPSVSHDGTRMVFLSRRPRPGDTTPRADWDIWMARLQDDDWGPPVWLGSSINTDQSEYFASLTPAGDLVFSAIRPGGSGRGDIYIAPRSGDGFGEPRSLGGSINTDGFESDPLMSPDQRFLLFTAYGRPGAPGTGDLHVSYARAGGWHPAESLDAINTAERECCAALTPDGRSLIFTREVGGKGQLLTVPLTTVGLSDVNMSPGATPGLDSVRVAHVKGNVYVASFFTRYRANVTMSIGGDGTLLVDIPAHSTVDTLRRIVSGLTPFGIRKIVSTHWHADHTGGNSAFAGEVPLIAHASVRERRSRLQSPPWAPAGVVRLPRHALPDVTFADSLLLDWNGERVVLIHVEPSHTDGDVVVYFERSGVAAVGDLFHGRGRFAGSDGHSGNGVRMPDALAFLERRLPAGTILVTGHGALSTLEEVAEYRRRYEATLAQLESSGTRSAAGPDLLNRVHRIWEGWGASERDIGRLMDGLTAERRGAVR